jgi:glycosyltransferase involved in cell wall biosynthesis
MVILLHSQTTGALIEQNLGGSEYSYYFVLKAFHPVLEQIGRVITVSDPSEVDAIYQRATAEGEECVFFSFAPPHRTSLNLACPTIPVIAWEYDTVPTETWSGQRHQDWRFVLNKFGRAITLSNFSANAIRSAMGPDFPVASIPAPIFDRFQPLRVKAQVRPLASRQQLSIQGSIVDTHAVDLSAYRPQWSRSPATTAPPRQVESCKPTAVELGSVIYTAILNPHDYRKNHFDLLCAFCWAFREIEDATLILKLSHHDAEIPLGGIMETILKLGPFKCQVVLIHSYLNDQDYENLLLATTYAVNTSQGEGQCIPLMESMSVGKPVIAPCHTAMIDYLSRGNAFLVASTVELAAWPQDPRAAYRALGHRIDFESLLNAFTESYRVAKEQPQQYKAMGEEAKKTLEQQNSDAVTLQRLRSFLAIRPRPPVISDAYGKIQVPDNSYRLGDMVDFATAFDARCYLGSGWGATEFGAGVWSNGSIAELCFELEQRPAGPLRLRMNLTAFVVKEHPAITVHVSAEDFDVARWSFGLAQSELIHGSWHEATIPAEATSNGEFSVKLRIDQPASPRKLGLSADIRLLGIMLHRLSISPEAGLSPRPEPL